MKTLLKITLLAMLSACGGCTTGLFTKSPDTPQPEMAMSVLGDITENGLMKDGATPEQIQSFLPIKDNSLYDGMVFRSKAISEAEDNEISEYEVKPSSYWLGEDQERISELKNFRAEVTKAIEKLEHTQVKPHKVSRVYENVCEELAALKATNGKQQVMICMSDMLHNEPDNFSFYRKADYALAKANPQAAAAKLQLIMPMPKMNSTTRVYIIHRPQTYEEQKMFDCAVRVFTLMLTQAGCRVYVLPNIINT